jgi:glycosyltransferase involved in cell wall biosynthesis
MVPRVSVIVPARDAAATLPALLDGLRAQDLGREAFEVLVCDDGSTDTTRALLGAAGDVVDAVLDGGGRGPAHARNVAAARARGDWLAFTDADCAPAPGWLTALLAAGATADVVQGRVVPARPVGPFDRTVRVEGPSALFETANLLVRRDAFDAVGGFEPGWLQPGRSKELGEDVLLGWKLRRSGRPVAFAGDAVVAHAVFARGPRAFAAERLRLRFFPAIVRRVPELREELLVGRVFLGARRAELALALIGVAAAGVTGRRAPLLAGVPYARRVHRDAAWRARSRGERLLVPAADVAADLVGTGALLAGGVRHRTVVL